MMYAESRRITDSAKEDISGARFFYNTDADSPFWQGRYIKNLQRQSENESLARRILPRSTTLKQSVGASILQWGANLLYERSVKCAEKHRIP